MVRENPVTPQDKLRYAKIASDFAEKAGVDDWEQIPLKNDGLVAEAWISTDDEKIISSPAVKSPLTLYLFLHEAAHHMYEHTSDHKPYHVEEYEATNKAFEVLNQNNVKLPCKTIDEAAWNVQQAIDKDRKAGVTIKPKAEEFVATLKKCSMQTNPKGKNGKRNPRSASDDMYESFHGESSDEVIEFENEEHYHSNLAALGELVELKVKLVCGGTAVIGFEGLGEQTKNPKGKKKNPFWPFNSFTKTEIYHVGTGDKFTAQGTHAGYKVYRDNKTNAFAVPALDRESRFDTKKDATKFIDTWVKKNPKKKGPVGSALKAGSSVAEYLDGQLGRALNPANKDIGPTMLCSNEDGTQLYFVGGSQKLDLPSLGIDGKLADKELITVGYVKDIVYHARKIFDGKSEEFDYSHHFSEESHGPLPILLYDRLNHTMKLSGGMYHIPRPLMDTSPGITD